MSSGEVLIRAGQLAAAGEPYVLATVVAVERPASTRRGDRALVTPDGTVFGWIGGACTEPLVIREALRALADREARLMRIGPAGTTAAPGTVVAESSCASEGTVEILVEPQLPRPMLAVVGDSPAAVTLAKLAAIVGWRVSTELEERADAVVVATMGHGDDDALAAALRDCGSEPLTRYVGLVASSKRAATVLASLRARGIDEESLARVRSPAGLDLGPASQEEIAVAVLAELVAWRHSRAWSVSELVEAIDPVCGMTVAITGVEDAVEHEGVTFHFCGPGCRRSFEAEVAAG